MPVDGERDRCDYVDLAVDAWGLDLEAEPAHYASDRAMGELDASRAAASIYEPSALRHSEKGPFTFTGQDREREQASEHQTSLF
jgi:hypothetical protein